ncbi:MAG: L-glutamate gamma-semialdehyde dehydrogenase [Acidobacteria bacterium]|nr:L-glutamate gamma-semialdehyde dehydrogenase [Acidobacteriota bacterium]
MTQEFKNEPMTDFLDSGNREQQTRAIEKVQAALGATYPLILGGKEVTTGATFESFNPSRKDQVVGTFQLATGKEVETAIRAAWEAFPSWSSRPAGERADLLFRGAALMRERRFELNAWMILEEGKSWAEADGDTTEAIDFLDFYAHEALRYAAGQPLTPLAGEKNRLEYIPLGAGAVIPPWNFPLAILAGMTTAAIAAGNTVILKPSSDSPGIGYQFMQVMRDAGMPPGVVNYLTGSGGRMGDALVSHPKIRFIAFTGSNEVGLRINELAAKTPAGQIWIKRVICEMGGKDFIIVDSDADLAAAAEGIVASAFGYQGQKCSACSRAIILQDVHDEMVRRIRERTAKIVQGNAADPATFVGPVINERAMKSILGYIEAGKQEGQLVCGGEPGDAAGFFIQPTVFAGLSPGAKIVREEIFGPVLAIVKAKDFDEAVRLSNDTEYGLTGAVYSNNRQHIDQAAKDCFTGNLYFNRKCTGALVGVHPFGGFNMSGTDSKAGGRDYLLLFLQAKLISEKVG